MTAAGRLLRIIAAEGCTDMEQLVRETRIAQDRLQSCTDGDGRLDPLEQLRLAAFAEQFGGDARRHALALYAQAQAALRMESGATERHTTYPKEHFR